MRLLLAIPSCAVALALAAPSSGALAQRDAPAAPRKDASAGGLPACISVRAEARYVPYGYQHTVVVTNGCTKGATCKISTDVNPEVHTVSIAASKTARVMTFLSSPARTFEPRVSCVLAK